jgi:hypothetical protein
MLKEANTDLAGVYDVTDHSEGESPFSTGLFFSSFKKYGSGYPIIVLYII